MVRFLLCPTDNIGSFGNSTSQMPAVCLIFLLYVQVSHPYTGSTVLNAVVSSIRFCVVGDVLTFPNILHGLCFFCSLTDSCHMWTHCWDMWTVWHSLKCSRRSLLADQHYRFQIPLSVSLTRLDRFPCSFKSCATSCKLLLLASVGLCHLQISDCWCWFRGLWCLPSDLCLHPTLKVYDELLRRNRVSLSGPFSDVKPFP